MDTRGPSSTPAGIAADIGLGVGSAVALAFTAYALADTWGGAYWVFGGVTGLVVCLIALARRRHRAVAAMTGLSVAAAAVLVSWLGDLPGEPSPAMTLGLAVLVGSATRALPPPWAGGIAAAGLAVTAGAWLAHGATTVTVLNTTGWATAVVIGLSLRLLDARGRVMAERVRRDERLALARELHDIAAHHLTGIVLQAQASQLLKQRDPETLDRSLAGIETAGSDALTAMRRVVGLLRDADEGAPATPGPEQLTDLVRRFEGHGPVVRLRLPDGDTSWPPEATSTIYRVVQESLTNIARHAPDAGSVTVSVVEDEQIVTVEVIDDAPPAPARPRQRGGYGLIGMRERVEALGGALHAGPRPGAGWSVLATLPLPVRGSR